MYEAFFSLEDSPFVLTPDPRFLLRSKGHHEILSTLLYGVTSQKGLMALIGDVGTGKTTLCRTLIRELPKDVQSALVLNPHLSDAELVGAILDDLGLERKGASKGELMTQLSQHLLAAGTEGKTVVVILDEAQQMSVEALEQIRILSTLETATRKLLQIVLSGQPELEERLQQRELRQLDQRIGIRCYLKPLSRKDSFRYVEHRLRIAGLPGAVPFSRAALARVYAHSGGIPRVINLVCDRAMMAAYSARAREVTPAMVRTAIKNLQGQGGPRRWRAAAGPATAAGVRRTAVAAGLAGVVGLGVVAAAAYLSVVRPALPQLWAAADSHESRPAPTLVAAAPGPPAAGAPASGRPEAPLAREGMAGVLAQALRAWGVQDDLSEAVVARWPRTPAGTPDVAAVAARYQLAATLLPQTSIDELRAIGLPAILELTEPRQRVAYILRRIEPGAVVLGAPSGEDVRLGRDVVDGAWDRAAWVVWRNVDLLPTDPNQEMTPTVLATLALRLQKLGHLSPPVPLANGARFQEGVRRFQRSVGLAEDGIVGPRTTLALSRVVGGRFHPTIGGATSP
jgi:general secretion pathway protein A